MSENILVVEYEPRYTDRVRQALAGQPFQAWFAKDGEEAMRLLQVERPTLIVLSSVIPKIATVDLIRAIRASKTLEGTPILVTASGYAGKSSKADAQRIGANDILPKPFTETEFIGKVHQLLGIHVEAFSTGTTGEGQLTSNEIFGDLFEDEHPAATGATKTMKQDDDVDKMVADKLAGMMPSRKKDLTLPGATPVTKPHHDTKPKVASSAELDKMLSDTLSGARKVTSPGTIPTPRPTPPTAAGVGGAAPAAAPALKTHKSADFLPDDVHLSQPILPTQSHPLMGAAAPAAKVEEEEPTDGTKFGQYVLIEKIAAGGMAEVWKARMRGVEGFQKIVAIKKILPHLSDNQDFIEMFIDEAKLAAQLNHNNIIHIYDLGKIQSSYYIAMEYIDGYDLKTILKRGQERDHPMTVEVALFVGSKIAAALDYAHRKRDFENKDIGLVHRDVSPQNVLISQEGDIKLCDFGIAKAASKASHTQAGALKGKLQYMSPEQAWGKNIDRRSDIFALGAVLFEMLTARKLFTGDNEMSVLEQVREAQIVPPSELNEEVTPEIDRIVLKALEKDPATRYQTAGEMEREINAILYSFRPTPTSADLAILMHRLWTQDVTVPSLYDQPPVIDKPHLTSSGGQTPAPVLVAAAAAPKMPAWQSTPSFHAEKKGAPVVPIVFAAIVLLGAVGGYFFLRSRDSATTTVATNTRPATAPPVAASPAVTGDSSLQTATIVPAAPTLDPAQVNEEVQKRLAAERLRLEQEARQQQVQQPAAAAPIAARPSPTPAPATPAPTQAAAPPIAQPVVTETQAAAPPVAPPTLTQAPESRAESPAPVREGDLVPAGTEGLVPARLLRRGNVPYPPLARSQRVQGTVIVNVLVSERGQVLDVRIIQGINRPVGLNEAAMQMMRRATFEPAKKDGVRVRTWTTVPVDFKL